MREHGTWRRYAYDLCRCEPCRRAYSDYKRNYRQNKDAPTTHLLRWPLQPLFQAAGTTEYLELAVRTGFPARTIHRWKHNGIPDRNADRAAVALGLHPMTIWPNYCDELEPAA